MSSIVSAVVSNRGLLPPALLVAWLLNHDDPEGVFWRGMPATLQHALRNSYYFGRFTQLTLNSWLRFAVGADMLSTPSLLYRYLYPQHLRAGGVRYASAPNSPHRDRRLLLDVYAPPPTRTSPPSDSSPLLPVLVYIHGGVWTLGDRADYRLMGERFADLGVVFVCPTYSVYPDGTAADQIEDVDNVLQWTRRNISRFGGDPSSVVLSGQSSGAHIASLCLLTRNRSDVCGFLGLSGPYDPEDHNKGHETMRGVNEVSPLVPAMGGASEMSKFAAHRYLHDVSSLPPVLLVHGKDDTVVPLSSTVSFFVALRRAGHSNSSVALLPGVDHSLFLLSIMKGEQGAVLSEMMRFVMRVAAPPAASAMATRNLADKGDRNDPTLTAVRNDSVSLAAGL